MSEGGHRPEGARRRVSRSWRCSSSGQRVGIGLEQQTPSSPPPRAPFCPCRPLSLSYPTTMSSAASSSSPESCTVLYKILTEDEHAALDSAAPEAGKRWAGTELDLADGFIHTSTSAQVRRFLDRPLFPLGRAPQEKGQGCGDRGTWADRRSRLLRAAPLSRRVCARPVRRSISSSSRSAATSSKSTSSTCWRSLARPSASRRRSASIWPRPGRSLATSTKAWTSRPRSRARRSSGESTASGSLASSSSEADEHARWTIRISVGVSVNRACKDETASSLRHRLPLLRKEHARARPTLDLLALAGATTTSLFLSLDRSRPPSGFLHASRLDEQPAFNSRRGDGHACRRVPSGLCARAGERHHCPGRSASGLSSYSERHDLRPG
jgi:hypothetical protein